MINIINPAVSMYEFQIKKQTFDDFNKHIFKKSQRLY